MATAALTVRSRARPRAGPALGRARVPAVPLALSAVAHAALGVAVLLGGAVWQAAPPRIYIVNLVPAVAAVGHPQGQDTPAPASTPTAGPRPPVAAPDTAVVRDSPTPRPSGARREPATVREPRVLPDRTLPGPRVSPGLRELPPARNLPAARDTSASLPEPLLASRPPALPTPGPKEAPTVAATTPAVAATTPARPPAPSTPAQTAAAPAPPASPPTPLGQPAGSAAGAGALTLSVADFPYAWYIQLVHRKIQEHWQGRALPGRQPEVIFEIGRDGRLRRLGVSRSSGNPLYDQVALRAVREADPFPPLPEGFEKSSLTVGLGFVYDPRMQ
jgi:protein TonB